MAAKQSMDEAFETHLQALTKALDVQASLVRSALELHPASSLVDFKEVAEDAITKFTFSIGDLRSDLNAVAAAMAGSGESPTGASVETRSSRSCPRPVASSITAQLAVKRASLSSAPSGGASHASCRSARSGSEADGRQDRKLTSSEVSELVVQDEFTTAGMHQLTTDKRNNYANTANRAMKGKSKAKPCIGGALNPDWPLRLAWDMLVIFLVLCDSVVIPIQLAEFSTAPGFEDVWLWLTVTIFFCDLVMNFLTGYHDEASHQEKNLVTDKILIAVHYLRGWFWIDFLSTVPWHVIADAATPNGGTSSDGLKLAKVVKLMRLLRLMRMLRLCKVGVIWERLEARIGSITALNVVSMAKVVLIWTAICHWGACIWWMVGKRDSLVMLLTFQDDDPEALHWTELPRAHSPYDGFGQWRWVDRPVSEQYVFCFYWILGVMRTMPAEVTPVNLTERLFVLFFMFFAVMAFAVNVARITQAWFKFSARRDAFKEEMVHVRAHLRAIRCGSQLQTRTQAYLNHLFEKRKLHAKEMGLLSVLPDGLKRKLDEAHRMRYLRLIPRLEDWDEPVLRRFCDATEVLDYLPGDKLTEKNKDADAAYVLMRGAIQIYTPTLLKRSASKLSNLSTSSSKSAHALSLVDEHCLFEPGERSICRNTVLALECSEVLRLDRKRFQEVLLAHGPSDEQLALRHSNDSARTSVSSFQGLSHRDSDAEVHGKNRFVSRDSFAEDLRVLTPSPPNVEPTVTSDSRMAGSPAGTPIDDSEQEGGIGGMRQASLRMSRRAFGMGSFREWQHISAGQIEAVG